MQKILRKRVLRDLKENVCRYFALGFLIVFGMYMIVSLVGAAETIITGTVDHAEQNKVEDGQFRLFVPLTDDEKSVLTEDGITLESHFYLDYSMEDDSILRVFSERNDIDLPQADFGKLPQKTGEIFLEKRFCEEHGISVNDEISVGGHRFVVCGIGTSPDYETPFRNLSDSAVDSSLFGVGFLTDGDYGRLKKEKNSIRSEEYVYAYLLNGKLTQEKLKEKLQEFDIESEDIDDARFQEYSERTGGKLDDFKEALDELTEGAGELREGLEELNSNSGKLTDGASEIFDAYLQEASDSLAEIGVPELTRENYKKVMNDLIADSDNALMRLSLKSALQQLEELNAFDGGMAKYVGGVSEAAEGSAELSEGANEFSKETEKFLEENQDAELSKLTQFIKAEDNTRIGGAADDQFINKAVGIAAGVIVLILFAYVISVFVVHGIEKGRMLKDAAEKKMDLILCASVSRFARNMTDCMEQIDNLKSMNPSHPVGVYFETENIYTLDPDCNQALSIHAMLADWESDNKSRRMILSYDQRICTGQFPVSDLLGYRHTADGGLVIQEDEALTVRFIFLARLDGYSFSEIAEILTERERKTLAGRTDWNEGMVSNVLTNERRWGDLRARKTIVINYKKGKTMKNDGSREGAYVPNHHEAIVSPEIARAVHMLSGARGVDGVPDVGVIDGGGLKGFVNINPCFGGIDRETIMQLSNSVYSDEEYACLEREAKIINGDAHSNILSMDFTGYYVPHSAYFIGRDTPTLTISRRQLKFNRKCHERFGGGRNIELLYHPLLQAIIIRTCGEGCGFAWRNEEDSPILNFSAKAFCGAVYEGQDWIASYSFRFRGIMRERGNSKAMIFFLDEPQIVADKAAKKAGDAVAEEQRHLPSRYIPYKNSELKKDADTEEWKKRRTGMLYAMRKHRDKIVDGLSEADIAEPGVVVENPLIGGIPTRDEVRGELSRLLMLM